MPREIDVEKEIDRLYGLPLEDFVAARKGLAQKLRKEGERAAALRVEDLRKPTAAAAVAAGERLHDAQAELLQGGNPDAVRKAAEDERRAISALLAASRKEGVTDTVLRRVESTLHAAAIDGDERAALAGGRLTKELEAAGFGLEGMPMPTRRAANRKKEKSPAQDRDAERRRRALDRARAEVEAAKRRSSDAAEAVKRAQEQLEELERSK
jgi:hypothetical protein